MQWPRRDLTRADTVNGNDQKRCNLALMGEAGTSTQQTHLGAPFYPPS